MGSMSGALGALVVLAGPSAAQIHVPGDHPDPQSAVDAASAGDVILVHGGTWTSAGPGPALVIDKALTLIGDPTPVFEAPLSGSGRQPPAIALAGPGSGTVVLANVEISGFANGNQWSSQSGGLAGGGFAEVHLYDCAIAAPTWIALSGVGEGSSGVHVDAAYLLLSNCAIEASDGADDGCYGFVPDGHAGLRCTGTVVALDTTVVGGTYRQPCFPTPGCGPLAGGDGGPGIAAARVDEAGCTIVGGPGASWSDVLGNPCGSAAAGAAVDAPVHRVLADDLSIAYPTTVGGSLTLSWSTPGPALHLFWSRPSPPVVIVPSLGEGYLVPGFAKLAGVLPSPSGVQYAVPPLAVLVGFEIAFQGIDPPGYVTRPVSVVLGP